MKAYTGFGTVLEGNGKFQFMRSGVFIDNWIAGMCWWAGCFDDSLTVHCNQIRARAVDAGNVKSFRF